jgi:hypothetical protein
LAFLIWPEDEQRQDFSDDPTIKTNIEDIDENNMYHTQPIQFIAGGNGAIWSPMNVNSKDDY